MFLSPPWLLLPHWWLNLFCKLKIFCNSKYFSFFIVFWHWLWQNKALFSKKTPVFKLHSCSRWALTFALTIFFAAHILSICNLCIICQNKSPGKERQNIQSILCFLYYHRAKAKTKYFNLESSFCCPKIFQSGIVFSPQLAIWHTKKWHILGKGELFQTFKSRKQTFCVWRLRLGHRHRSTHLNRNGNIYIFPLRILYLFILHHTSVYRLSN